MKKTFDIQTNLILEGKEIHLQDLENYISEYFSSDIWVDENSSPMMNLHGDDPVDHVKSCFQDQLFLERLFKNYKDLHEEGMFENLYKIKISFECEKIGEIKKREVVKTEIKFEPFSDDKKEVAARKPTKKATKVK